MKVSPDSTFLIYTDSRNGMIKLNASTGAYLGSTYVGNTEIYQLYAQAISPNSASIMIGGWDYTCPGSCGYWTSMSSSSLSKN